MAREMLINVAQEEECRIAVMANRRLEELYVERLGSASLVGNIYKGKVVNVEPSIQACFIDFGVGQNGFLHISDVQSSYLKQGEKKERVGKKKPRKDRPPIQDCIKKGQEIIVQVIKEGIGTKGPTLSTYLSIPGRFLVLMPGMNKTGVSRKIEDEDARGKLKVLLGQLDPPKDMGIIMRTAAQGSNKRDLQRDMNYLLRLWKNMTKSIKHDPAPTALYQESDLITRTIRDVFNTSISKIHCDSEAAYHKVRKFLSIAMPRSRKCVTLYKGASPMFKNYKIEQEIELIQKRHVPLASGGSIVIDQTEALVAIDINSGKYREQENAETTAFKINVEAAQEIARQLRLRDLGGVIVIDFIDMIAEKHKREVERTLRAAVSTDRASTKILRTSQFGLVEMTRQRMKPSLKSSIFKDCPHCKGSGLIKTPESMSIEIMRHMQYAMEHDSTESIDIRVSIDVAAYLQNRKRSSISDLEKLHNKSIEIHIDSLLSNDEYIFTARNGRGMTINSLNRD
ncbi:MAG: Rne/Rng family ribonuclease [Phycisphaerae bacterium]|nr:Rne/Rng family ribonuclease [Phycisphaerae bacterium]